MPAFAVLREKLTARIGNTVTVSYSHYQDTVTVLAVDPEGFLCRTVPQRPGDEAAEFWLPFKEVTKLETSPPRVS